MLLRSLIFIVILVTVVRNVAAKGKNWSIYIGVGLPLRLLSHFSASATIALQHYHIYPRVAVIA